MQTINLAGVFLLYKLRSFLYSVPIFDLIFSKLTKCGLVQFTSKGDKWCREQFFPLTGTSLPIALSLACSGFHKLTTEGDGNYNYKFTKLDLDNIEIIFDVSSVTDVRLSLSQLNHDLYDMYEIILGGWSNQKSVIRRCKDGCEMVQFTSGRYGVLGAEFRSFWLQVNEGQIAIGRVGDDLPFLQWNDPEPLPVEYFGFATGSGRHGQFHFCDMGK